MANYYGSVITETINPFGRGTGYTATLSTGVQYGAMASTPNVTTSQLSTAFWNLESVTVPLPINAVLTQLEIGLTAGVYINTTTTDTVTLRCLVQDAAQTEAAPAVTTAADILLASTASLTASSGATITDYTLSARITPTTGTYFTGRGSFRVIPQIAASATTSAAEGGCKNSSYVTYKYYLLG